MAVYQVARMNKIRQEHGDEVMERMAIDRQVAKLLKDVPTLDV